MKHNQITFLSILIIILFIFTSGCKKDSATESSKDTEKPTVSITFPGSGSDIKADTTYMVIADAIDNIKVTKVDFYINGQYAGSDSLSPYEYQWSTQGLTGSPTIMAKAFDEAGNIGTSIVITVRINGAANHPPAAPSNPTPADSSVGQVLNPTLRWLCSDPDGDAITYDVFFGISNPPMIQVATGQSSTILSRTGLINNTKYYWKVNAKDSKGAVTTGTVWSFTTAANNPPVAPSNPSPANSTTGVSTYPTLSWSCIDPDGDALTYDVYFGISSNPTTTIATNQSATSINWSGLADSTTYYWKVVAKDSKGATTSGTVWLFTTGIVFHAMIPVAGGTFQMGSNSGNSDEQPIHLVTVGSFSIDKYEVTYEKWITIRDWGIAHGYDLTSGANGDNPSGINNPVTMVSWYDIMKWCNAWSEKDGLTPVYYTNNTLTTVYRRGEIDLAVDAVKWTGNGYRLPTEAEWEFAARGGNNSQGYTYSGSNTIGDVAWYTSNSGYTTHTIGTKSANELGIYDMSGNVWEWCWDWYGAYSSAAQLNPKGATSGTNHVTRGGSFIGSVVGSFCRVAARADNINGRSNSIGFRCIQY